MWSYNPTATFCPAKEAITRVEETTFSSSRFISRDPYLPALGLEVEAQICKYLSPGNVARATVMAYTTAAPPRPQDLSARGGGGATTKARLGKGANRFLTACNR